MQPKLTSRRSMLRETSAQPKTSPGAELIVHARPAAPYPSRSAESGTRFGTDIVFLRLPEVKAVTGLSKTSLYEMIRINQFPKPVALGPRTVAWVRAEVQEWATERINAARLAQRNLANGAHSPRSNTTNG